jgi:hypothetical protein
VFRRELRDRRQPHVARLREAVQQEDRATFTCREVMDFDAGYVRETILNLRLRVRSIREKRENAAERGHRNNSQHEKVPPPELAQHGATFFIDATLVSMVRAE